MTARRRNVMRANNLHASKKFSIKSLWLTALEKFIKFRDATWSKVKKTTIEYFENSSINCYQYIVDFTMEPWERWLWRSVHIAATGVAIWLIWVAGNTAILAPVATTRAPSDVPISNVPHPAIAICPYNKISRTKATRFAEELILNKSLVNTVDETVELLSFLGLSYDMELPENDELDQLHYLLGSYNMEVVMKELAPNCSEVLKRCLWRNELVDCSDIFVFRKTNHGFCCIFNYRRGGDKFLINKDLNINGEELRAAAGQERGLSILIDPMLEDYLYTTEQNAGFSALIFGPGDYPDIPSGGCFNIPIPPQTEVYTSIDAISVTSNSAVEKLSIDTRKCLFASDSLKFVDSFSDCMMNCRLRYIHTTCECVPFFLPYQYETDVCDLTANMCLKRWKDTWGQAWSGEDLLLENGEIAGNPKQPPCSYCLPSCEEAIYRPHQYTIALQPDSVNNQPDSDKSIIKKDVIFANHSVVHFFFSEESVIHLELGLLSNWWDLLSSLGGLCGLVLGGSIISVVEIVYFCLGGPATKFKRPQQELRQLYWEELRNYKRR